MGGVLGSTKDILYKKIEKADNLTSGGIEATKGIYGNTKLAVRTAVKTGKLAYKTVKLCKNIVSRFKNKNIKVIRFSRKKSFSIAKSGILSNGLKTAIPNCESGKDFTTDTFISSAKNVREINANTKPLVKSSKLAYNAIIKPTTKLTYKIIRTGMKASRSNLEKDSQKKKIKTSRIKQKTVSRPLIRTSKNRSSINVVRYVPKKTINPISKVIKRVISNPVAIKVICVVAIVFLLIISISSSVYLLVSSVSDVLSISSDKDISIESNKNKGEFNHAEK